MLQQFLNNNFIQITEDENLNKLKKASDKVLKKLVKDKTKVIEYTLVAIDPEIPADNGIINEVREIVIESWNTFSSNAKDTPIVYIRAVILEALEELAKDPINGTLIWFTSKNLLNKFNINDKEKPLLSEFLLNIGNKIESNAVQNWSAPQNVKLEKIIFELKSISADVIDPAELQKRLRMASVHSGWGFDGLNPHTQATNNAEWPKFFSESAGASISELINASIKQKTKDITANFTQVKEKLNEAVNNIQEELLLRNVLFQIRTNLLWWKEAGYSASLDTGYKAISNGTFQLAVAKDYSHYIPHEYPVSVEYFLAEALKVFSEHGNDSLKISDFISAVQSDADNAKKLFKEPTNLEGRQLLINFIAGLVYGKYNANQFKTVVGISEATEISSADLTTWLFHDNQILKLVNTK
jgi:hypothetical protein